MAVDDGEAIIVILLGDESARVLTESADLVFEWSWVDDELGYVEGLVEGFHNFVTDLDTDTNIDWARFVGDIVFGADLL